jgi:hypothetical protein
MEFSLEVVNFLSKHRVTEFLDFAYRLVFQTNYIKHNVAKTGHFSILMRGGKTPTLLASSERANFNHWIYCHPHPKLQSNPLSEVCDSVFNISPFWRLFPSL